MVGGGYHLSQLGGGVPCPAWGWGVPCPAVGVPCPAGGRGSLSTAGTCYVSGGMPLAFTQEDFLVLEKSESKSQ